MRRMFTRLTAAGLLATTLALAGCSGNSAQPAGTPAKPINLTMMTWMGIGSEASQAMAEAYTKKHPNVHITLKDAAMEQMFGKDGTANTALTDGVDIAMLPTDVASGLNRAGALKDLSSLRLPNIDPAIAPLLEELGKASGKRYGLPISVTAQSMLLSQQALTQAGGKEPPLDWTVQEFEQVATALKNAGVTLMLPLDGALDPILHAYGGQVYDATKQRWTLDTPETKQGLAELAKLVKAQLVSADTGPHTIAMGGKGGPGLIATGGHFMINGGPGGSMLTMPTPRGPKGRGSAVDAVLAVVNAHSANADVALDFVREILANPTAQVALAKAGIRPVSADSAAMAAWHETVGDRTAQVTELSLQGAYVTPEQVTREAMGTISQTLTPYFNGTVTLDQVLPGLMNALH